mmetsp:Transcript_31854/g.83151  ORF Transcript_31854/g.83151 Transcript_31854/m.83151 type:complete len:94 (-) Transcript_31854:305-586(-)|eukprot:CAMPEP_0113904102 /NCGR_PEP_ID=MMETSP0780_2-20120614/22998_1 /TAXON_ID=652834 /ORGANISM="Palpitomonas bilix" /LENGTH=93 /DNA_ID=CAMNT_0000897539 /DNA_START=142 /DNA_END=423 /DNA_ORIENTATION=+ /assembly_acc=CAM_ASM_000599
MNLTAASCVILVDPWWNPAVEEQAIDRVYRIGQKKPVTVHRLVVTASIEERMLAIQEKKAKLATGILVQKSKKELQKMREQDLRDLFGNLEAV